MKVAENERGASVRNPWFHVTWLYIPRHYMPIDVARDVVDVACRRALHTTAGRVADPWFVFRLHDATAKARALWYAAGPNGFLMRRDGRPGLTQPRWFRTREGAAAAVDTILNAGAAS